MLKSIKMKNIASYDTVGAEISNLHKINFIYGVNACGKTTVSNFLADTNRTDNDYSNCSVDWENDTELNTLVYNKEFRDKNFGFGSNQIKGVFTLGEATTEKTEELRKKNQELKDCKDSKIKLDNALIPIKKELEQNTAEFYENIWKSIYKKYEIIFKEAFVGCKAKASFANKLISMCESGLSSCTLLMFAQLEQKAKMLFGTTPQELPIIQDISYETITTLESDKIWKTIIVGKDDVDIAKLITDLNSSDWVDKGRSFLKSDNICPFCQKETITSNFREQLEKYFDKTFKDKKDSFTAQKSKYEDEFTKGLEQLLNIKNNETDNLSSKLDMPTFDNHYKLLQSHFQTNKEYLKSKQDNLSNSIDLIATSTEWEAIINCIKQANDKIKAHNNTVKNYASEKEDLKRHIWVFLATQANSDYQRYKNECDNLKKAITAIEKKIDTQKINIEKLDQEIIALNKSITSVQPTVDEINRLLKGFGFSSFKVVPSSEGESHYTLKRENGQQAQQSLSEGEITFITILYFLQLVKGGHSEETVGQDRIIVIDDPISSLDSNVLAIVSTLIKILIANIKQGFGSAKQLILLTHNIYFHKEVSYVGHGEQTNNDVYFWVIRINNKKSIIQEYKMINPIKSSYELLWHEIINYQDNSGITVQNSMRRIIEYYFKFLGQYKDKELIDKFETIEEQNICRSLLCWLNDGSHCISDDLYVQQPNDSTEQYLLIFENIFKLTEHIEHYNMMMKK